MFKHADKDAWAIFLGAVVFAALLLGGQCECSHRFEFTVESHDNE